MHRRRIRLLARPRSQDSPGKPARGDPRLRLVGHDTAAAEAPPVDPSHLFGVDDDEDDETPREPLIFRL